MNNHMSAQEITPLQKLRNLPRDKQRAFLALFAGARTHITIYRHKDGTVKRPKWGKAECEWVEDWQAFYFRELVDLGFMKPEKLHTFTALGMGNGTDWTGEEWEMQITDDGFAAREAWWADWRARIDALDRADV